MTDRARRHLGAVFLAVLATVVVFGAAACGRDGSEPVESPTGAPLEGTITVYAASSLSDAFKEAGAKFQAQNPKTKVEFQFAASSALAVQITEGAPADVFAAADTAQMKAVTDKGGANEPAIFVKNTPVIVVPKNSTLVASFADLAKPDVKLVLAGATVPVGRYAREVLTKATGPTGVSAGFSAKVLANLRSEEANVRAVLTKVQLGEADAGVVYKTDIGAAANDVKSIDIPANYNVIAEYPIATVKGSRNANLAAAFVAFIRSAEGQAIMEKYGFAKP